MLEIIIDNRDGNLWDISPLVSDVTYRTTRIGKASTVELTLIKGGLYEDNAFRYGPGDVVRIRQGEAPIFYGYVFTIESGRDEAVKLTAYDQLRYLMASDSYVFQDVTAADVIRRIASDFQLNVGTLEDTGYVIPKMVENNAKLIDIICKALDQTLIATLRNYVFYDDFGELTLRDVRNRTLDVVIGDESLLFDYKEKKSIDNSYNRVKIVQDRKEKGVRYVYIEQDSANIAKWGLLQYYLVADENRNEAQISQSLRNYMRWYNRESRSLTLEAIGDIRVRAGCYLPVRIAEWELDQFFLVDSCTHRFSGADHTMSLELIDIRVGEKPI
jgi:hypothetical protein